MILTAAVEASLEQAKMRLFRAHGNDPTFTGCGIGLRRRAGARTDEPVVVAMVNKKLNESQLSLHRMLPRAMEVGDKSYGVDVVEVGRPRAVPRVRPGSAMTPDAIGYPIYGKFASPIQGCDISQLHSGIPGALGCLVRENTTGDVHVLSSNYVMGGLGSTALGTAILQPSESNGTNPAEIAKLSRSVSMLLNPSYVDASIARLNNQSSYSKRVANELMAPISASHPAVGMVTAWDDEYRNCFLSRMDRILPSLNVSLLPVDGSSPAACVVAPTLLSNLEKVGPATGYTSSVVDALSAIVNIDYGNNKTFVLWDLIWTQAFNWPGDSGAVACVGGNGHEFAPVPSTPASGCSFLGAIGDYYGLPLTGDNALTSQGRDQFLAQSQVGNLLIGVIYANTQVVISRLASKHAPGVTQAYADFYYSKYHALYASALANPAATTPVSQENLDDAQMILSGLYGAGGGPSILTTDEKAAAQWLYTNVLTPTLGMNYQQVLAYMNDPGVYRNVYNKLAGVSTIAVVGPVHG